MNYFTTENISDSVLFGCYSGVVTVATVTIWILLQRKNRIWKASGP